MNLKNGFKLRISLTDLKPPQCDTFDLSRQPCAAMTILHEGSAVKSGTRVANQKRQFAPVSDYERRVTDIVAHVPSAHHTGVEDRIGTWRRR